MRGDLARSSMTKGYELWVASRVKGRDGSHGMAHFERVRRLALELAPLVTPPSQGHFFAPMLLELTALSHDVCDHKYVTSTTAAAERELMALELAKCGLSDSEVLAVTLAAENVSLSKELREGLQDEEMRRAGARWLRDVVSDADKLDALGTIGLRRLLQYNYNEYKSLQGEELATRLRLYSERHLEHRVNYLVFEESRRRGLELLREMREAVRDVSRVADLLRDAERSE